MNQKINIIGAGSWGTTISNHLVLQGYDITLYTHSQKIIDSINNRHVNEIYFDEKPLEKALFADHIRNFRETDITINVVPTQFIRDYYNDNHIKINRSIINASKGVERNSNKLIHQIFFDLGISSNRYAVLTGPSHAEEVYLKKPTVVVAASENDELAKTIQEIFSSTRFRVYTSNDITGAEIGGALKNVIALAAGICYGLDLGDNLISALLTRGLAEIMRLGIELGADNITLAGLSGLGDLFATCSSEHSRNRLAGKLLAQGKSVKQIESENSFVAEGIYTASSALALAQNLAVEMPIVEQINLIINENKEPLQAVNDLMVRDFRSEFKFN